MKISFDTNVDRTASIASDPNLPEMTPTTTQGAKDMHGAVKLVLAVSKRIGSTTEWIEVVQIRFKQRVACPEWTEVSFRFVFNLPHVEKADFLEVISREYFLEKERDNISPIVEGIVRTIMSYLSYVTADVAGVLSVLEKIE